MESDAGVQSQLEQPFERAERAESETKNQPEARAEN